MVQRLLALAGKGVSLVRRLIPAGSNRLFTRILYATIASLGLLLATWENADKFVDRLKLKIRKPESDFDFIVVGSGSAGAIVANRLSENPAWKVLLLEAGGEPSPLHAIPAFALFLSNYKATDWSHLTVPQKNSGGSSFNNQVLLSQGRSLGGTANINHMIQVRGSPADFDNWASITGDHSWNYKNLLPHFRKSEDFRGEWANSETHGTGGPVRIEVPAYQTLSEDFINAGQELGYAKADLNGYFTEGFDAVYNPARNGRRHAVYRSFIRPARRRKNLSIYKFAHVNKVLINENNEAYGVEYDRHGRKYQAFASKEVILSAGAIQSPKILMLSGVGPAKHLHQLGIPVKVNLPVGNNLQDHVGTFLGPFVMESPKTQLLDRDISPGAFIRFLTRGQGPLTSVGPQGVGIVSSNWAKHRGEAHWPDLLTLFVPLAVHRAFGKHLAKTYQIRADLLSKYYQPSVGKDSFFLVVSVGRPTSTGTLRLSSSDPYASPLIDPKYYDTPEDVWRMVEAIKFNVKIAEQTYAFKKFKTAFTSARFPGCEGCPFRSDEYWECFAKMFTQSLHHMVGTCRMGSRADPRSVVDTKLRVVGVRNLRVIDASIMPVVPVSNTQASTFMIGEKGAALIKEQWTSHGGGYGAPPVMTTSTVYGPPGSQYLPWETVSKTINRREISPADFLSSFYNMSADNLKARKTQSKTSGTESVLTKSSSMQNQVEKLFATINEFQDLSYDAEDALIKSSTLAKVSDLDNLDLDENPGGLLKDFGVKKAKSPQGGSPTQLASNKDALVMDEESPLLTEESTVSEVNGRDPLGFGQFISDVKKINDQLTEINEKSQQLAMKEAAQELRDVQKIPTNPSLYKIKTDVKMELSTNSADPSSPNNFLTAPAPFSNPADIRQSLSGQTKYPDNLHVVDGSRQHLAFG